MSYKFKLGYIKSKINQIKTLFDPSVPYQTIDQNSQPEGTCAWQEFCVPNYKTIRKNISKSNFDYLSTIRLNQGTENEEIADIFWTEPGKINQALTAAEEHATIMATNLALGATYGTGAPINPDTSITLDSDRWAINEMDSGKNDYIAPVIVDKIFDKTRIWSTGYARSGQAFPNAADRIQLGFMFGLDTLSKNSHIHAFKDIGGFGEDNDGASLPLIMPGTVVDRRNPYWVWEDGDEIDGYRKAKQNRLLVDNNAENVYYSINKVGTRDTYVFHRGFCGFPIIQRLSGRYRGPQDYSTFNPSGSVDFVEKLTTSPFTLSSTDNTWKSQLDVSYSFFMMDKENKVVYLCGMSHTGINSFSGDYSWSEDPIARWWITPIYSVKVGTNIPSFHNFYDDFVNFLWNGVEPEDDPDAPGGWADEETDISGKGEDPYKDKYNSEVRGGDGSFENRKDVDNSIGADTSGILGSRNFYTIYTCKPGSETNSNMYQAIAHTLTTLREQNYSINPARQQIKDFYNTCASNIEKSIIGLFAVPYEVNKTPTDYLAVGGVGLFYKHTNPETGALELTTISKYEEDPARYTEKLYEASSINQIFEQELGEIKPYYGNFLDYAPYSSASIYLPYVGTCEIPINLIYNKQLKLRWNFNNLNGDFVVVLFADGIAISHWSGNCAMEIKMIQADTGSSIGKAVANAASLAFGSISATVGSAGGSIGAKNQSAPYGGEVSSNVTASNYGSRSSGLSFNSSGLNPFTPVMTHSHMIGGNGISASNGWLDSQNVMITVERPVWARYKDFAKLTGNKAKMTITLKNLEGFNIVQDMHLRCSATRQEQEELLSLLKQGVIF